MSKRINFLILFLVSISIGHSQFINGKVLDSESGIGIPFAKIYCVELQNGVTADSNGYWQLENTIDFQITLQISADEFDSKLLKFENAQQNITVSLEPSHVHLDEIIVSTSDSKLQRYSAFPVESRKITDLNKIEQTNLVDAMSNIAGVYNFSTGNGIAKPVIRGLSGMRVLTSQNGLRLENQQWGADHGFAVLNLGIERVEIIKGPSSLIYGADALGGVIYLADEPYSNLNKQEIKASTKLETNSMATVNKISFKTSKNNLRFAVYGGYFSRANYAIGNSQFLNSSNKEFVANSKNTGGSFKTAIGYNKKNWITNFRYQILYFQNGLPGHTHDSVWEASSFLSSDQSRNYTIPAQKIINHLAQWENKFYFKKDEFIIRFGFTSNDLKEYGEKLFTPGIDMTLQNTSYNLRWKHNFNKHFEIISGSQGMLQTNSNGKKAEEILVPNSNFNDFGAYSLIKGTFNLWNIQAGARYDQRSVITKEVIGGFDKIFSGVNYSAGISRSSKKLTTRLNASTGFRPPHISELLADGVHHATMQYLIGDRNFESERANQLDLYLGTHFEHLEIVINPFINLIDNYIYKIQRFNNNNQPEVDDNSGLFVFDMKQTDAVFSGGDIAIHYHPHVAHWLHLESNLSLLSNQDSLPFIPQNRLNNIIKIDFKRENKLNLESLSAQYVHFFDQNNVAPYETPSSAYQLINLGCTGSISNKYRIDYSFGVNNLLNVKYIDHLSRLKTYEIPNAGRNIYVKISLTL
ncbi:MAG: TonB-dependent receptor [Flavobacteriales bacterium]|nr:TonB-dependent receptor [Flavobacteriales bacterium]